MSKDPDYLYALELQKRLNADQDDDSSSDLEEVDFKPPAPSKKPLQIKRSAPYSNQDEEYLNRTQNLVHPMWETLDPTPDIFALFGAFNSKFFQSRLKCVSLEWSKRMYSCAGICYSRRNRFGMDVTIRLSEPLLKLRPRKDLVETMLHEMIHAYCFVLHIREGNGGHGPNFKKIMYGINKVAGTNITVYHTFHDEVDLYKQHWWRCNGACQNRAPFFGYVKRTSNRAPGANDQWWAVHQESCGGTFMKIKGPDKPKKATKKSKENIKSVGGDLRKFFPTNKTITTTTSGKTDQRTSSGKNSSTLPSNTASKVNGFGDFKNGPKGAIKTNGGNTVLLNPKTARKTTDANSIAKAFPPTSYPGLSTDPFNTGRGVTPAKRNSGIVPPGGNLRNVMSFRDLNAGQSGLNSGSKTATNGAMSGRGYAFDGSGHQAVPSRGASNAAVDRQHLRDIWSKRFRESDNADSKKDNNFKVNKVEINEKDNVKRRRLSEDAAKEKQANNWVQWDDDIMLKEQQNEIIALSSGNEDDSDSDDSSHAPAAKKNSKPLTAAERQNVIKQEILEDTVDLDNEEDIVLIDDDYDDNASDDVVAATELADSSIIDEFFGDDTLLTEFKRENDVRPTFSRYEPNPNDDIITCPICQGKLKRSLLAEHLDGCSGIATKIVLPKHALQKLASTAREVKPTRRSGTSRKDILRKAGYTEQDLLDITSSADEAELLNNSCLASSSPRSANSSVVEVSNNSVDEQTRSYRQRNIFKTTRQCPVCAQEVEELHMNNHLDECLSRRK